MKIIFDNKDDIYRIKIEDEETTILIKTDDIAEAKAEFVNRMTWLFDSSVRAKFKEEVYE